MQALELHRVSCLSQFSKAFIKIYYFPKFDCHILGPSKVTGSLFNFLTIFNKFPLQLLLNHKCCGIVRTILCCLLEDNTIITNFLNCQICNTSRNEINTFFAIYNKKYKCYEIGYAELSGKVTVFKKYVLLKVLLKK